MATPRKHILVRLSVILFTIQAESAAAAQGPPCDGRAAILEQLERRWREVTVATGIASGGGLVELLASEDGRTWTLIVTQPGGRSCVLGHGRHWRRQEAAPKGRPT